jgi:hypothetical protein
MNDISCPRCSSPISAVNVNIQQALASCPTCHAVFSLSGNQVNTSADSAPPQRAEVGIPERFQLTPGLNRLTIEWKWWTPVSWIFVLFTIVWNGFLVIFISLGSGQGASISPNMLLLISSVHIMVGLFLIYFVVASWFNTTTVTVDKHKVTIKHEPVYWAGNTECLNMLIDQLYCVERIHKNKNGTSYSYQVHLKTKDGQTRKLITGLKEPQQALFLEQEIEKFLDIENQPIRGELPA